MPSAAPAFHRPWWLPNTHLETAWARRLGAIPPYHRELADTPDRDLVAFDYLQGSPGQPAIVIFHGLEGCSRSHTVRQLASFFHELGWPVLVPHFRTCGVMNRLPRAYHAGDSTDVEWMLRYAAAAFPQCSRLHAVGISLGGNALAKWLGEDPAQDILTSAAIVCAPLDLDLCSRQLDKLFNQLTYGRYFLKKLKRKIERKLTQYPFLTTRRTLARVRTLRQFDDTFTAPMHGFLGVDDYYRKASALPLLGQVNTPLLCLQSDNDALIPRHQLPDNPNLHSQVTRGGGHSGFVSAAPFPGSVSWLGTCLQGFFEAHP